MFCDVTPCLMSCRHSAGAVPGETDSQRSSRHGAEQPVALGGESCTNTHAQTNTCTEEQSPAEAVQGSSKRTLLRSAELKKQHSLVEFSCCST